MNLIELVDGKQILLLDGFPFYKKGTTSKGIRWCCNKSYCKSFVQTSLDLLQIIRGHCEHDHPPSKYAQSSTSGKYIRLEHIHDHSRQGAAGVSQLHVLQAEQKPAWLPLGLHQEQVA